MFYVNNTIDFIIFMLICEYPIDFIGDINIINLVVYNK